AYHPEQRRIVGRVDGHIPSIDDEICHPIVPCRCTTSLTAMTERRGIPATHRVNGGGRSMIAFSTAGNAN
ncbi:MAG: hypothetical protein J0H75_05110, partial [Rhizobiales bacterium]|nr:hypothetical protein [Hyphomicrobiales bacterium]